MNWLAWIVAAIAFAFMGGSLGNSWEEAEKAKASAAVAVAKEATAQAIIAGAARK